MLRSNLMRSVASLAISAGLLAVARRASAQGGDRVGATALKLETEVVEHPHIDVLDRLSDRWQRLTAQRDARGEPLGILDIRCSDAAPEPITDTGIALASSAQRTRSDGPTRELRSCDRISPSLTARVITATRQRRRALLLVA